MHEQNAIKRGVKEALKKLMTMLSWKKIFMDVAKFYIYLIIFYGLAILLMWAHAYWSLEADKISLDEMMSAPLTASLKDDNFNLDNYEWLGKKMSFFMFILVCLGVFFSDPPKTFKHISAVIMLIFLINSGLLLTGDIVEYFYDFCMLAGFSMMAWVLSLAWHEYKNKNRKLIDSSP